MTTTRMKTSSARRTWAFSSPEEEDEREGGEDGGADEELRHAHEPEPAPSPTRRPRRRPRRGGCRGRTGPPRGARRPRGRARAARGSRRTGRASATRRRGCTRVRPAVVEHHDLVDHRELEVGCSGRPPGCGSSRRGRRRRARSPRGRARARRGPRGRQPRRACRRAESVPVARASTRRQRKSAGSRGSRRSPRGRRPCPRRPEPVSRRRARSRTGEAEQVREQHEVAAEGDEGRRAAHGEEEPAEATAARPTIGPARNTHEVVRL